MHRKDIISRACILNKTGILRNQGINCLDISAPFRIDVIKIEVILLCHVIEIGSGNVEIAGGQLFDIAF